MQQCYTDPNPNLVLKIYGIYTHAQLDRRFWDCMGRHLERKGAEYRKRLAIPLSSNVTLLIVVIGARSVTPQ